MTDGKTKAHLTEFEESLTEGYKHGEWHYIWDTTEHSGQQRVAVLYFMDAEYDPVRVTFDFDEGIEIHADGAMWHTLTADQLRWLAHRTEEVTDAYHSWSAGEAPDIEEFWGKPGDEAPHD